MSEFITNGELRIEAERLCGENEQLRSRVEELESENTSFRDASTRLCTEVLGLCDENKTLRERNEELERFGQRIAEAVFKNADVTLFGVDYTPIDSDAAVPPLKDQFLEALNDNEKLKEYGARLFDKVLELGTENGKLREWARAAWTCIRVKNCSECRFVSGGCTLYAAMCELGIGTGE